MNMIDKAREFATQAHAAQRRRFSGLPYITHPASVAAMVAATPGSTPEMVAAAWLHDVVEDTEVTHAEVREAFGEAVGFYVWELTDVPKSAGSRRHRKSLMRAKMVGASNATKTIKLADMIDNMLGIIAHDPTFAKTYVAEKRDLLDALKGGDADLHATASKMIADYFAGSAT